MKTHEDGHEYELDERFGDGTPGIAGTQSIRFVNREPGHEHDGVTTQEVIRALIDRTQYCDKCLPWSGNKEIVKHLRMALAIHEARALIRKVERGDLAIERLEKSNSDHHLVTPDFATNAPSYAFENRTDTTETGSLMPGAPCHTPAAPPKSALFECPIFGCAETTKPGDYGCKRADCPFCEIPF